MKKRIAALCAAGIVAVCGVGLVFAADPGSDGDPLISKSYIDNVLLPKIYSYIDSAVSGSGPSDPQGQSGKFEVVNVGAGKSNCRRGDGDDSADGQRNGDWVNGAAGLPIQRMGLTLRTGRLCRRIIC